MDFEVEKEEQSSDNLGSMEMSVEKAKNAKKTFARILKCLRPQRFTIILAFIFAIINVSLALFAPTVMVRIFDEVLMVGAYTGEFDFDLLREIVTFLIIIYAASAVANFLQDFIMAKVAQSLVRDLRKQVGEKLSNVPLKFYDTRKKGEILSRVTNDLESVGAVLQNGLMRLFTSAVMILGATILMFRINVILALISLGSLFLGLIITGVVMGFSNKYFTSRQKSLGTFNAKIDEYFTGQTEIKVFTLEEQAINDTNEAIEKLYKDDKKAQFIMFAVMPIISFVNRIGFVIVAILGATFVIDPNVSISLGRLQAFFTHMQQAQDPLAEAAYVLNELQAAIAGSERVFELLDEEEMTKDTNDIKIKEPKGNITFENVKFGYSSDNTLMNDVNFEAKPGQKVAIVGPTGAGKTTLINLLMRFYEINDGSIKVDGHDTQELDRTYLRTLFGMVLQDSWMCEGTISDNIAYGKPDATRKDIEKAAKMARIDYFIKTLPDGYETVLSDENASISQGQKQLICIARAILANPSILLLDEATSSVDTRTEVLIQEAMDELMNGRTSFVIAHRLSTIKNADLILVMNKGDIIESGNHKELMKLNGFYTNLYNSQFQE